MKGWNENVTNLKMVLRMGSKIDPIEVEQKGGVFDVF
jgi:hypothetical protein